MTTEEIKAKDNLKKVFSLFKKTMEFRDILTDNQPKNEGEISMLELWDKALLELDKEEVDFKQIDNLLVEMENQADINKLNSQRNDNL